MTRSQRHAFTIAVDSACTIPYASVFVFLSQLDGEVRFNVEGVDTLLDPVNVVQFDMVYGDVEIDESDDMFITGWLFDPKAAPDYHGTPVRVRLEGARITIY
jgi:hypothetical protein